jgi:acyl-CoA synthetase (AMP-forming)/AMP-acid ligase II
MATYHDYLGNPEANEKKLIRDVFQKGDVFQRSGDLLVHASDGWVKFVERAGDSYRWKGENVSAGEVKDHISRMTEVQDIEVYGVVLDR